MFERAEKERLNQCFKTCLYPCSTPIHIQRKLPLETEQREPNLLIELNDHGPFHHLSQKLEEITSRKEKELHTRQPVPTPTLWEHSSLSLKNTQGIKYKYTDLSEINKL